MELKEILSAVKESVTSVVSPLIDGLKGDIKAVAEKAETTSQEIKSLGERVSAIEKLPVAGKGESFGAPGIVRSQKFLGYRLADQGIVFKDNMKLFRTLNTEERIDEFNKYMLALNTVIKSGRPGANIAQADEARKFMDEFQRKTAMAEGTDAYGGYAVPDEFKNDIISLGRKKSFALDLCTVFPMSSDTMKIPGELTLVDLNWSAETSMTETEPTLTQVSLSAKDLDGYSYVSNDLMDDSAFDIVSWLNEQFAYGVTQELDNQVLNGTGSPCSGILTAAVGYSTELSGASYSTITAVKISDLEAQIPEEFEDNLTLILNKKVWRFLRTEQDNQGNFIYQRPQDGQPASYWEIPIRKSGQAPSSDAASTAFVALGNLKYFYIGQRKGIMRIEADPFGLFTSKQTRFRIVTRWGMSIAQSTAFGRIVTSA